MRQTCPKSNNLYKNSLCVRKKQLPVNVMAGNKLSPKAAPVFRYKASLFSGLPAALHTPQEVFSFLRLSDQNSAYL
jgi:hypothetical protein